MSASQPAPRVLASAHNLEVIWVDTSPDPAQVIDLHTFRYLAFVFAIHHPVRVLTRTHLSITTHRIEASLPYPTAVCGYDEVGHVPARRVPTHETHRLAFDVPFRCVVARSNRCKQTAPTFAELALPGYHELIPHDASSSVLPER